MSGPDGGSSQPQCSPGQILTQSTALTVFTAPTARSSLKGERGEEAAEEKFEAGGGGFMRREETARLYAIKEKVRQQALTAAAASCLEGLAEVTDGRSYHKEQMPSVGDQPSTRRRPCRTPRAAEGRRCPAEDRRNPRAALPVLHRRNSA